LARSVAGEGRMGSVGRKGRRTKDTAALIESRSPPPESSEEIDFEPATVWAENEETITVSIDLSKLDIPPSDVIRMDMGHGKVVVTLIEMDGDQRYRIHFSLIPNVFANDHRENFMGPGGKFVIAFKKHYPEGMGETARDLNAEAEKLGFTFESALKTLREASEAARETTAHATETPRPESGAIAQQVFAEAAAKSSRRYQRHLFTENELRDPETINRARDTLADIEAARRVGAQISNEQRLAGRWAKAFIRKAQQRGPA
jgi:hypothetical protein